MEVEKFERVEYVLRLDSEEANWLKNAMQNPLHGEGPLDEDKIDAAIRKRFWSALNSMNVGVYMR